jgi:hypothetical protein
LQEGKRTFAPCFGNAQPVKYFVKRRLLIEVQFDIDALETRTAREITSGACKYLANWFRKLVESGEIHCRSVVVR